MFNKHVISVSLLVFFISILSAQNCLPDWTNFKTQSDIDSFPIKYPGCTVIEGTVCIGDCQPPYVSSDIKNLDGLTQLTSILGRLLINNNDSLTSLQGLSNITVMENDVEINSNAALTSLEGLDQVTMMKGSFTIFNNPSIVTLTGFEMLDTIIGALGIGGLYELTSISAFSNLKYLGGYQVADNFNLPAINDMNNLQYLGSLFIDDNYNLTDLPAFPLLSALNGDFILTDNYHLTRIMGFENINRIIGSLIINVSGPELLRGSLPRQIHAFHNLTYVGGDLLIPYVDGLDTLDGFTKVDSVGQVMDLNFVQAVHNFPQNNQFKYIGGDISLESLDSLHNLECFSALEAIYGKLYMRYCPNVVSLSGIEQLTEVGGSIYLSLKNLPDFSDLSHLNAIGGSLTIDDCDSLADLSGLEGVTMINGELFIFGNENLVSLEGIRNIDPQSFQGASNKDITIIGNPRLGICNIDNICEALRVLMKSYWIYGNGEDCNSINEIYCEEYGLSGLVFFDLDQNKLLDTNEVGVPGIHIQVEPDDEIAPTNENGNFLFIADEGSSHTLQIDHGINWILTTDSSQFTRVFISGSPTNNDMLFGIYPASNWIDLTADLTSDPIRCNQNIKFFLHYLNACPTSVSGKIELSYDEKCTFISAIAPADSHDIDAHKLIWEIDSISPLQHGDVMLTFKMPSEIFLGYELPFTVRSLIDSSGTEIQKDSFTYAPELGCAFDPNDKIVMPPGLQDENYTLKNDALTYTVRFENKGNLEAIDITILDTLDSNLDMSTFKVINSSYPVYVNLDGHLVEFFFKNIWLGKDEKGFVSYEIKPLADVQDNTTVENYAGIIFDFNQPIITNTTFNTLVDEICEDVTKLIDTAICNGNNYLGLTEPGVYYDTVQIGSICDSFTEIHLTVLELGIIQLDTSICEGESFHGFGTTGVYTYDSINLVTGCMDVVVLNLEVIPLGTGECVTGITTIKEKSYKVYPIPAQYELFIDASKSIESVSLYTVQGRKVELMEIKMTGTQAHIQWHNNIPDGIYILTIRESDGINFEKIILSK